MIKFLFVSIMIMVLALNLSGCNGRVCTDELGLHVEPLEGVISVGESLEIDAYGIQFSSI